MKRLITFKNNPKIIGTATVCGPKEARGNLAHFIDKKISNDYNDEKSFELAERKMLTFVTKKVIEKCGLNCELISAYIGGDLLNQIISSSFCAREFNFPFLGVYSACSTMTESMLIGACMVDAGYMKNVVCVTGSHFSTAERQYRYPLEQGTTRPAQSQWTVTGAGANLISCEKKSDVFIKSALVGKVVDYGVSDVNNMGAAMAPAAADTLLTFFEESGKSPKDFDMILTGDLGSLGSRLLKELMNKANVCIDDNHVDCGEMIYNIEEREYQGGSGAGCGAVVFNSYVYKMLLLKKYRSILFLTTGALLSTTSSQQGETVPGISHLIEIEVKID